MSDELKIAFQLTAREGERLEVRVAAPGGETRGETSLPPRSLLDGLALADPRHISSTLVEQVGGALYGALVSEAVDELVVDTLNDAIRASQPLQFELRFDPDQVALAEYPWEMIRNTQGQFLVRDGLVDLTRYITYPQPPPVFDETIKNLPLFRVICQPPSLPPISAAELKIKPLEVLSHAKFEDFLHRLLIDRLTLWGLHFDGHGALVAQCGKCDTLNGPDRLACWNCGESLQEAKRLGALAFEKNGDVNWVATGEFGSVLYNAHVRLALLLSCETAKVGTALVFSGVAPGLLLAGVPAVIGMQYPVLDTFANSFANEFYSALARDNDLLAALRIARRMNMQGAWYSPALYLRRKPGEEEEKPRAVFLTRNIDTAAPAQVNAGADFLVRLWIRRPETKPLTVRQLRKELDIPVGIPVRQSMGEAEVKFAPVEGRKLRRGEIDVQLSSTGCYTTPDKIKLFIDEQLDAPAAIFTARGREIGRVPLLFSVWQDGGMIHSVTHHVEVVEPTRGAGPVETVTHSESVAIEGEGGAAPSRGAHAEPPPPPPPPTPGGEATLTGAAARLVAEDGRAFPITPGSRLTIGRSPDNDIHLSGDKTVSRQHAVISEQNGRYILQDLQSTSGTLVNGQRINAVELQDGDLIRFGAETQLRFVMPQPAQAGASPSLAEDLLRRIAPDGTGQGAESAAPDYGVGGAPAEEAPAAAPPSPPEATLPHVEPGGMGGAPEEGELGHMLEEQPPAATQQRRSMREYLEEEQPSGKKCPVCAEMIPEEATICPYCGSDQALAGSRVPAPPQPAPSYAPEPLPSAPASAGKSLAPRQGPSFARIAAIGCGVVVVVGGLIVVAALLLGWFKPRPSPTPEPGPLPYEASPTPEPQVLPPTLTPYQPPADTSPPVVERAEHSPSQLGYGQYCSPDIQQFTVRAYVRDDSGPEGLSVLLTYWYQRENGERVGRSMTAEMKQVEPGVFEVTIPTSTASEAGFTDTYGTVMYIVTARDSAGNESQPWPPDGPNGIPIYQCIG